MRNDGRTESGSDGSRDYTSDLSDADISRVLGAISLSTDDANDTAKTLDDLKRSIDKVTATMTNDVQNVIDEHGGTAAAAQGRNPPSLAALLTGSSQRSVTVVSPEDSMTDDEKKNAEEEKARKAEEERRRVLRESMDKLDALVGLDNVKEDIRNLKATIIAQKARKEMGLLDESDSEADDLPLHLVLLGRPGTGKTTVARIYAGLLRGIGLLAKGQLVETDRSGLVAEYVGQTAQKTNKIINSALDGVLFIDEVYNLNNGANDTFGQEAISTLMKRMEDDRDRLVVIIAGYTDETERFLDSNPGLRSRFVEKIMFDDYTDDQLVAIAEKKARGRGITISESQRVIMRTTFDRLRDTDAFANGRTARVLIDNAIKAQSLRYVDAVETDPSMDDTGRKTILTAFTDEDMTTASEKTIDMSTSRESTTGRILDEIAKAQSRSGGSTPATA